MVIGDLGKAKQNRGLACVHDPEKRREIAAKGGRAAHEKGTAHEWTQDEARAAGRLGGHAAYKKRLLAARKARQDSKV